MGPVSGLLWLAGSGVAVVGWFLPGSPHDHAGLFWGLVALTVAYSLACITRLIPWDRVSIGGHALAVTALQPLVAASLWLTGGADAYMGPVLVLPMLYVAYFFPARYAWPLAVLEVATYASPFLTSDGPYHLLGARTLGYAVAYAGLVATIQFLKRRLVIAERQQHRIARIDPLTGLQNRRGFDESLSRALEDGTGAKGQPAPRDSLRHASRCCWPTSTPSSRSTTASATRPATASCASWPRTLRPRSAAATAWRGSEATSSRWSPRAPAPKLPCGSPSRSARPARASTPATARSH